MTDKISNFKRRGWEDYCSHAQLLHWFKNFETCVTVVSESWLKFKINSGNMPIMARCTWKDVAISRGMFIMCLSWVNETEIMHINNTKSHFRRVACPNFKSLTLKGVGKFLRSCLSQAKGIEIS